MHAFCRTLEEAVHLIQRELKGSGLHILRPSGQLVVFGDIHGDLETLVFALKWLGVPETLARERYHLLFLGDLVDRGVFDPEVLYIIMQLKTLYPRTVTVLRGNHEGPEDLIAYPHDLPQHLRRKFGHGWEQAYRCCRTLFNSLPHAALLPNTYLFLHGGPPHNLTSLEQLATAHTRHPQERLLEEILWNDPHDDVQGVVPSPRGAGYLYGPDVTTNALRVTNTQLLIRSHEPAPRGIRLNHNGRVITLFSRKGPPYWNKQAAILVLDLQNPPTTGQRILEHVIPF